MSALGNQTNKKNKRKNSRSSKHYRKLIILEQLAIVPIKIGKILVKILYKFPKLSFFVPLALLISYLLVSGATKLHHNLLTQLPSEIAVQSNSEPLEFQIQKFSYQSLKDAQNRKMSREAFVHNLTEKLVSLEVIDSFSFRFGLTQKLHISAIAHTPAFIAELVDDNKTLLISNKLTVMGKLGPSENRPAVPTVMISDAKISTNTVSILNISTKKTLLTNINLPKLNRLISVTNKYLITRPNIKPDKYIYKNSSGLAVALKIITTETVPQDPNITQTYPVVTAILGEENLEDRLKKLDKIIASFQQKKDYPELIDLSFDDKAIIRMKTAEAISNAIKL